VTAGTGGAAARSAATLADVVAALDAIIETARAERSPMGYFPALYRKVTRRVRQDIAAGDFDDGPRMERLATGFAGRYLDACDAYRGGRPVTAAWTLAFSSTGDWRPVVLQHLLLGMNAHINLDLGIAAARVAPGRELASLKGDFDRINGILGSLVQSVQDQLATVWPVLRILDGTSARTNQAIVNFAMGRARDQAWSVAERLAPLGFEAQEREIAHMDRSARDVGRCVRHPGLRISTLLLGVRLGERGNVPAKIAILERTA
jgi:hypothetical protein